MLSELRLASATPTASAVLGCAVLAAAPVGAADVQRSGFTGGIASGIGVMGGSGLTAEYRLGWALSQQSTLLLRFNATYAFLSPPDQHPTESLYRIYLNDREIYSVSYQYWIAQRWWTRAGVGLARPNASNGSELFEEKLSWAVPLGIGLDVATWRWGAVDLGLSLDTWRWRGLQVVDGGFVCGFSVY